MGTHVLLCLNVHLTPVVVCSLAALLLVHVKNQSTAWTTVVGILEVVYKKWNQAAAEHQPVRRKEPHADF